jgi:hypothetical protein
LGPLENEDVIDQAQRRVAVSYRAMALFAQV